MPFFTLPGQKIKIKNKINTLHSHNILMWYKEYRVINSNLPYEVDELDIHWRLTKYSKGFGIEWE